MKKNRQLMIEGHGITMIRTNPDASNLDMNRLINRIYMHISQPNKKKIKKKTKQNKRTRR